MNNKLDVKDLINVGLFTILIFLFTFLSGMIGFIPVLIPILGFVGGIVTGPIYMLYVTKIKKPGMIFITQMLIAVCFVITGHGLWLLITTPIGALIVESFLKKSDYKSIKKARIGLSLGTIGGLGNWIPIFLNREDYFNYVVESGYGQEFATKMMSVLPNWSLIPIVIAGIVGMYIGCTIGIKILKKHFERAGMIEED